MVLCVVTGGGLADHHGQKRLFLLPSSHHLHPLPQHRGPHGRLQAGPQRQGRQAGLAARVAQHSHNKAPSSLSPSAALVTLPSKPSSVLLRGDWVVKKNIVLSCI